MFKDIFKILSNAEMVGYIFQGFLHTIVITLIAAAILYALPEVLRGLADYRMLLYAIVLIAMMLLNNNPKFVSFKSKLSFKNLFGKGGDK